MAQRGRKQQWMFVDFRSLAGRKWQSGAPFLDAVLETDKFVALSVRLDPGRKVSRIAMKPEEMRRIDGIFHRLQPIAVNDGFSENPSFALFPHEHIPPRQQRF